MCFSPEYLFCWFSLLHILCNDVLPHFIQTYYYFFTSLLFLLSLSKYLLVFFFCQRDKWFVFNWIKKRREKEKHRKRIYVKVIYCVFSFHSTRTEIIKFGSSVGKMRYQFSAEPTCVRGSFCAYIFHVIWF